MFFIILIYVILFRICLASPGESSDMQSDKDLTVPEQVDNVQESINPQGSRNYVPTANRPLNYVSISEWGCIGSLNDTDDINLDRMHDFDNFDDESNLTNNLQGPEIPFEGTGIFHIEPAAEPPTIIGMQLDPLDNNFTKPWVLQFYSDEAELILIKGCGPYHLLTKEDQKKVAHTLKTMIDTHYSDLKWYEIVIVVDTYGSAVILKPKPASPAHCRTYSKRVRISGHLSRLMFA